MGAADPGEGCHEPMLQQNAGSFQKKLVLENGSRGYGDETNLTAVNHFAVFMCTKSSHCA